MISDLDKTLKALLCAEFTGANYEVSFDTPDNEFQAGTRPPTVNLFLYDIRENRDLRDNDVIVERHMVNGKLMATERRAPVRVDCSYLVTAWGSGVDEEHRLLGDVMRVLLRYPILPAAMLHGALAGQDAPLPASVLQPGMLQSMGEFWQALGGRLKAALHYTVTIGMDLDGGAEGPVVTEKVLHFTVGDGGA